MNTATMKSIPTTEFTTILESQESVTVIDVRTPKEYQAEHLANAINIPVGDLSPERLPDDGRPVYVLCHSGARAKIACRQLSEAGFERAVSVEGGLPACIEAGLPVVHGQKVISLERQVRIAAGSLVLVGVVLGVLLHPGFFGLSAFVGAGLIFAGVTDTCGMAMLIGRMPWNKV